MGAASQQSGGSDIGAHETAIRPILCADQDTISVKLAKRLEAPWLRACGSL